MSENKLLITTIILGAMFPISVFGLSIISEAFIIVGVYFGISALLCGIILIDIRAKKSPNLILIGIIMIFFGLSFLNFNFYRNVIIATSISYAIIGMLILLKGIISAFKLSKYKANSTVKASTPISTNEMNLEKHKQEIQEYNRFRAQVYLCASHKTIGNETCYVCIHKETKELFEFTTKIIGHRGAFDQYCFKKPPQKITTYPQLLKCLNSSVEKFNDDLNESNWETYFSFMLLPSDHSKDILRKQLLSCDCEIVRNAVFAIHDLVLKRPEERKEFLSDAYRYLPLIKKNTYSLDMGGMFVSGNRFVHRAIEIIEGNNTDKCFCRLLIDEFGPSANGLAKKGFILIEENKKINENSVQGVIECPICHRKYSIIEEYTGWHIPTMIHCFEISE